MDILFDNPYAYIDTFLLILVRVLGMILIMPFMNNKNVPNMSKVAFSFFFSVILMTIIPIDSQISSVYLLDYGLYIIKEFLTGWVIGFGVFVAFSILTLAGQFIDYQIGFSMVNVFDPLSQTQITITGNLYYFLFLMIFLTSRSYYYIFKGLVSSFYFIPLGQMTVSVSLFDDFLLFFNTFFLIALQIAAPIFFVMILTNAVLGILARTVPQLNMFVIGFPLKILLGLLVLFITLYLFGNVSEIVIEESVRFMQKIIRGLSP